MSSWEKALDDSWTMADFAEYEIGANTAISDVYEEGKGAQFPGRRTTAGGAEKSQHCHNYFLQCGTFVSERP